MKKKKIVLVYPIHKENIGVVRWLSSMHSVIAGVSPGYLDENQDIGELDNRNSLNIPSKLRIEEVMQNVKCDLIIIYGNTNSTYEKNVIMKTIKIANRKNIPVLPVNFKEGEYGTINNVYIDARKATYRWKHNIPDSYFYDLDIPTIYVGGLLNDSNTYEVIVGIVLALRKKGIKVVAVANEETSEVFGIYSMPKEFFDDTYSPDDKIKNMKRYLHLISRNSGAEILIVQIPGALMEYSEVLTSGYGIIPYLFSKILIPELFYFTLPYELVEKDSLNKIVEYLNKKYDFETQGIFPTNQIVDGTESFYEENLVFYYQTLEKMKQVIKDADINIQMYSLYEDDNFEKIAEQIMEM